MATITDLHITGLSSKKERLAGKEKITYTTKIRHAHIEDYSAVTVVDLEEGLGRLYTAFMIPLAVNTKEWMIGVKHNQTQKI